MMKRLLPVIVLLLAACIEVEPVLQPTLTASVTPTPDVAMLATQTAAARPTDLPTATPTITLTPPVLVTPPTSVVISITPTLLPTSTPRPAGSPSPTLNLPTLDPSVTIPLTPGTAGPTPTLPVTVTPYPTPVGYVTSLIATPNTRLPGGAPFDLIWQSSAPDGSLQLCQEIPGAEQPDCQNVSPNGSRQFTVPDGEIRATRLSLIVQVDNNAPEAMALAVGEPCEHPWFFGSLPQAYCPQSEPLNTGGAAQFFQRGIMVYVGTLDRILVLHTATGGPLWEIYEDTWDDSQPIDDPGIVPPEGFYQPQRGFGQIWRDNEDLRFRLGWATDPEGSIAADYQCDRLDEACYLLGPGQVFRLEPDGEAWSVVTP